MELQFIGHSAFYIKTENAGILIDPAISENPSAKFDFLNKIDDIFVTHAHMDHLGDSIPLSKKNNAMITTVYELANYCTSRGAKAQGGNVGGKITFSWGSARFLSATHSSSTVDGSYAGCPVSFLFEINGIKIYHAGDTGLHSDMKILGEIYKPDVAILPIGGTYTMDIEEAAIAASWIKAPKLIPMHYNTFPPIAANTEELKKILPGGITLYALSPGESLKF